MGQYAQKKLIQYGFLNIHAPDFGEMATSKEKVKLHGFCTSDKCCYFSRNTGAKFKKGIDKGKPIFRNIRKEKVFKTEDPEITDCPDCKSVIVWTKV